MEIPESSESNAIIYLAKNQYIIFEYQGGLYGSDAGGVRTSIILQTFIQTMRNTTKLKQILLKYDLDLSMDDDSLLKITLVDKISGTLSTFENNSYS